MTLVSSRWSVVSLLLSAMLFALCSSAWAQQPKKVFRIGFLSDPSSSPDRIAFRQGLRELGYVEGENLIIEYPSAEKTLAAHAAELVRLNVDVIVTGGATATRAAKEATATIPIVFLQDPDPVGNGVVTSLARPAGNITGLSSRSMQDASASRRAHNNSTTSWEFDLAIMRSSASFMVGRNRLKNVSNLSARFDSLANAVIGVTTYIIARFGNGGLPTTNLTSEDSDGEGRVECDCPEETIGSYAAGAPYSVLTSLPRLMTRSFLHSHRGERLFAPKCL